MLLTVYIMVIIYNILNASLCILDVFSLNYIYLASASSFFFATVGLLCYFFICLVIVTQLYSYFYKFFLMLDPLIVPLHPIFCTAYKFHVNVF